MNYKDKLYDFVEEINKINGMNFKFEGVFKLRVREYENERYPQEIQIALMFIKEKMNIIPIEIISHTFAQFNNSYNEDHYYEMFYRELLNFIIFSRTDTSNRYVDIRGEKVIIRSIADWLIKKEEK